MFKFKTLLLFTVAACAMLSVSAQAKLTVFAAASMTNVLEGMKTSYLKAHPEEEIDFSFASSSVLARQISQGAPADLFVSANQKWMDFLAEKNAIVPETRTNLVQNALVMIAPKNSQIAQLDVKNPQWQADLNGSYLAVGDPAHVPAGKYAQEALTSLNQWGGVEDKLARANNVRLCLSFGRARGIAIRHYVCYRCRRKPKSESGCHLSYGFSRADRISRRHCYRA